MNYRDAREDDADALTQIANNYFLQQNISRDSMQNLVQDRTVKVAEKQEEEGDGDKEIVGYVSYQATQDKITVQHVGVVPEYRDETGEELLQFPVEFAERHGMTVRLAVEEGSWLEQLLHEHDFEVVGAERFEEENLLVFER